MDTAVRQLVQVLHDHPVKLVMVTAGAGTLALSWLLGVAGASRTLLEALAPYSAAAFDDFLGRTPAQYVAADTAAYLAGRALTRARWLDASSGGQVGLAGTATIVTDRPKRGEHRAHIVAWRADHIFHHTLQLEKGARDRAQEEALVSRVMLNALADACELAERLALPLGDKDRYQAEKIYLAGAAANLVQQKIPYFALMANGRIRQQPHEAPTAILSGAFNPLHEGHLALGRAAAAILGRELFFEVAAVNVDKPPLSVDSLLMKMAQFAGRWPVCASCAPTYAQKAQLFPGTTFVVGYDTAVRILTPRYYNNSSEQMMAALEKIDRQGGRFLVAGRVGQDGRFREANRLAPPARFAHLFQAIPGDLFRCDISSSALRASGRKGSR